ncbi:MAG: (2,3-dihydroxybenzoyl)adenylate synthase [Rubrivivax sp.]|nr:MAG: (2,3-dihydroxybenzoyl)adenylate synthase [Rubrivivax sp.]
MNTPALVDLDFTPWPPALAARYRERGYWLGEPLWRLLANGVQRHPDRLAVVCGARRWSYADLDERARRVASGFSGLGIGAGDHVVVQLPNVAEFFVTCFALWRLGARPVMALPGHRLSEMSYFCAHTQAVACVVMDREAGFDHPAMVEQIQRHSPALRHVIVVNGAKTDPVNGGRVPFDALIQSAPMPFGQGFADASALALLQLSGGSTGLPKLIPRTHDDYAYSVRASAEICALGADTVYLAVLPVAHNFPLSSPGALGVWHAGGTVVLSRHSAPEHAFALIEQERVSTSAVVPPLAQAWLEALPCTPHDISSLRTLQVGGAKLAPDVARRIVHDLGCRLQQVFGMAEGLVNYTRDDDPLDTVLGTQGRPISPDDEVRVVDDEDIDVTPGECGHLLTRGPYTIRGYFRADAHNERAFTADGYYRTGDVVRQLGTGHLVVEGRAKDQINRGGEKIAAEEVESHLLAHPAIHDVALISVPDHHLGERSCAVVVARGTPPTRQALAGFLRQRGLANYKYPDRYEFVEQLPKTSVGKINKRALREQLIKP